MNRTAEHFLSRWSRLKRAGEPVATPAAELPVAPLPDPLSLNFDTDFSVFLRQEVEESVKRVALKTLFHSPQFNIMDGLDVYIDDYSLPDPLDQGMLENLAHARDMLFPQEAVAVPAAADVDGAAPLAADEIDPALEQPDGH